jgi:hypothetical protein
MCSWSSAVPAAAIGQELSRQLAALTPSKELGLEEHLDAATAACADLLSVFLYCGSDREGEVIVRGGRIISGGSSSSSWDVKGLKRLQWHVEETKAMESGMSKKEKREMQSLVVNYLAVKQVGCDLMDVGPGLGA